MPNSWAFFWTPRSTGCAGNRLSSSQRPTASPKLAKGGFAVLPYLLGPLALFPRRWRKLQPAGSAVEWRRATVLSGFGEAVIALIARGERVLPGSGVHREQSGDSPAFLLDKIMRKFSGRCEPSLAKAASYSQVFLLRGRYLREGRGQGMNFALTEACRMLEIRACWRKAGTRRARSVSRIAITGWRRCPGAAHRGRFATFCGNCRRVRLVGLFWAIR